MHRLDNMNHFCYRHTIRVFTQHTDLAVSTDRNIVHFLSRMLHEIGHDHTPGMLFLKSDQYLDRIWNIQLRHHPLKYLRLHKTKIDFRKEIVIADKSR